MRAGALTAEALVAAMDRGGLHVRAIVESSEPVTGYAKTSHQHPRHLMAWTQPLRKGV